jgi:eukaryotic-like serine/threonine-protein kinase
LPLKKYDEAVDALQQALAIQERVFGPVHPNVAEILNELGNVASMRDKYDEAEARFRHVADIYRAVYGDHHYLVAIALSSVAYNYANEKDYPVPNASSAMWSPDSPKHWGPTT